MTKEKEFTIRPQYTVFVRPVGEKGWAVYGRYDTEVQAQDQVAKEKAAFGKGSKSKAARRLAETY